MSGEITLRGKVLPVGGIKEKLLAAYREGIREAILPLDNKPDLKDLPKNHQVQDMTIHLVETYGGRPEDRPDPGTARQSPHREQAPRQRRGRAADSPEAEDEGPESRR